MTTVDGSNLEDCPRCGHGVCWHPPAVRVAADSDVIAAVNSDLIAAVVPDPVGCAGNCQVCDLIERVLDVDAWQLNR